MAQAFVVGPRLRGCRADGEPVAEPMGACAAVGADTLLLGRACRRHVGVEVRLLRLTAPCAGAPVLGRDGLAAGPGDLRRHSAAQLVHHCLYDHP